MKVIRSGLQHNIHIMCEPAHTSHQVQSMDKLFHPLQDEFEKCCYAAKVVDIHSCVNTGNFVVKLHEAMEFRQVKAGFKRTGIYPVDRTQISNKVLTKKSETSVSKPSTPTTNHTPTSTSSDTSPSTPSECPTCGARKNVLVSCGIVDESLQHILVPPNMPDKKIPKNRRSMVPSGQLITKLKLKKCNVKYSWPGSCHLGECWVNKNMFKGIHVKIHLVSIICMVKKHVWKKVLQKNCANKLCKKNA